MRKFTNINGYIAVKCPGHPNAMVVGGEPGWVYEHRLVMECELGRHLEVFEEVHHLNGVRSDNTPSNLILLNSSHHTRLHNYLRDEAAIENIGAPSNSDEYLDSTLRCPTCLSPVNKNKTYCSVKCATLAKRTVKRPDMDALGREIAYNPITTVAEKYGVSDNSIRKWCKSCGLPFTRKDIR